jgi:hypothetical protein
MALDIPKEYAEEAAGLLNTSVLPSDNAEKKRFTTYTPEDEI